MARQNRRDIFDPNEVGAFHTVQRTVRRAWLCGMDPASGKSFEHRRTWIQNRLQELAASQPRLSQFRSVDTETLSRSLSDAFVQ